MTFKLLHFATIKPLISQNQTPLCSTSPPTRIFRVPDKIESCSIKPDTFSSRLSLSFKTIKREVDSAGKRWFSTSQFWHFTLAINALKFVKINHNLLETLSITKSTLKSTFKTTINLNLVQG